ncbi:hypothetical protein ABZP36_030127 [Zizania latifolia]
MYKLHLLVKCCWCIASGKKKGKEAHIQQFLNFQKIGFEHLSCFAGGTSIFHETGIQNHVVPNQASQEAFTNYMLCIDRMCHRKVTLSYQQHIELEKMFPRQI